MGSIVSNFKNRAKNQAKNEVKKAAKKALKQVAKVAAKLALKLLMFLLSNPIGWIILILIIIIFAFSSVDTTAKAATTVDTIYSALGFSEGTNNFVGLVEIKSDDTGSYWSFKSDIDEKIDNIIKSLRSTTGTYTIKDKELIKKMIKAELVSTLPNLGGTPDDNINNFQGIVNIQGLTYVSQGEFENKINSGIDDVGNYFSVNPENANVLIANTGKSKEINLQNTVVSKYSMPFEYLLYFLMCSDEKAFIVEMTDNVLKSYINITISSSDVKVIEANTWCVKISGDGTVDASASGENSVFSTLYKKYRIRNKIYTDKLFKCLEQNSKTQKLLEMTKYLIYTATGQEFDNVTNYDFSGFTQSTMKSVSSTGDFETLKQYIGVAEGGPDDGEGNYIVYLDTVADPPVYTVGPGVNLAAQGYRFTNIGYNLDDIQKTGYKLPKDIVDRIADEILEDFYNGVKAEVSELNLTVYQLQALTSRKYNCGNIDGFKEAYNKNWNKETDDKKYYNFAPDNRIIYEHKLYTEYMSTATNGGNKGLISRRESEWRLFTTGYYDKLGIHYNEIKNSADDFLEAAQRVWNIVCENNGSNYKYGGAGKVPCYEGIIDCSSYVTWALYEYGYTSSNFTWQWGTDRFLTDDVTKYGWETIPVEAGENPIDKLKPGDLLVRRPGHITIIAEIRDGRTYGYDCGDASHWKNRPNGELYDNTWFLTGYSGYYPGEGRIIRVKSPN